MSYITEYITNQLYINNIFINLKNKFIILLLLFIYYLLFIE